jgi:Acetyltransferases, including N-acetylases of ribosomal proteins
MAIIDKGTIPFYTKRLYLRRFAIEDAPAMFETYAKDKEITKYLRWTAHKNVERTREVLNIWVNNYSSKTFYQWVVCLKETGELIGSVSAFMPEEAYDNGENLEVGYCFGKKYWGNGYATEALKGMLTYLTLCGYESFVALHAKQNPASGKVMGHVGMRRIGEAKIEADKGRVLDCFVYKVDQSHLHL